MDVMSKLLGPVVNFVLAVRAWSQSSQGKWRFTGPTWKRGGLYITPHSLHFVIDLQGCLLLWFLSRGFNGGGVISRGAYTTCIPTAQT